MPKILIVEDHDAVRSALRDWLALAFPHCEFLLATTGEDALRLVKEASPDIVLMDYGLPVMNGIQATRQIKAINPTTKIIMISIHEDPKYQTEAALAGATHYIAKRKMQQELPQILAQLL